MPPIPTESESAEPAQETDPYALLKRDVNSLSEAEKQERANLLKQKYVDEWKQKKEKENEELSKDLTDDEESKEETGQSKDTPKASMKKKLLGGFDNLMEKGGTKVEDFIDSKKDAESEKTRNTAQIASGAWGMFSNSYSLFRSHQKSKQKRKKGDSIGAGLERFNMFSNLFGIAAGGTDAARGIAGFKGNDTASPWLDMASGIAGLGKSATDTFKGMYQSRSYGKLANRKETESSKAKMANEYMRSREKYKHMKEAYDKNEEGTRSKESRMEMLKQRNAYKRSKDYIEAMNAAQETAKNKSKAGKWAFASGALKTLSGGLNLAEPLLAKKLEGSGTIGKAVGTGLKMLGKLAKFGAEKVEKAAGGKQEELQKQSNTNRGKEYLDEKVASFLKKPDAQADHVTEEEAKFIIAQRLGVEDPSNYEEIYKKLSERRAERILNKEEGYEEVLAAMGLTKDADKATILEALGVS